MNFFKFLKNKIINKNHSFFKFSNYFFIYYFSIEIIYLIELKSLSNFFIYITIYKYACPIFIFSFNSLSLYLAVIFDNFSAHFIT